MSRKIESPGTFLRTLRIQRKMTLMQAAAPMGLSTSSLSRLERDGRAVERSHIEAATAAYHLSAWETHQLYSRCGISPRFSKPIAAPDVLRMSSEFVRKSAVPAVSLDQYGYLVLWNGLMQVIWPLPSDRSIHALESLFDPEIKEVLGSNWHSIAVRAFRLFHARSVTVAHNSRYFDYFGSLADQLGDEYTAIWNESIDLPNQEDAERDMFDIVSSFDTRVGLIRYVPTAAVRQMETPLETYLFVPYTATDFARHLKLVDLLGADNIHFAPSPLELPGLALLGDTQTHSAE